MKIDKALRREKKRRKQKSGMRIDNKSIFVIQGIVVAKAQEVKRKRKHD